MRGPRGPKGPQRTQRTRRTQGAAEDPEDPRGRTGQRPQEDPRAAEDPRGLRGPRRTQEGPKRTQEDPRGPKRTQEDPRGPKRTEPQGPRRATGDRDVHNARQGLMASAGFRPTILMSGRPHVSGFFLEWRGPIQAHPSPTCRSSREVAKSSGPIRDRKLKESPAWMASSGRQPSAVGFDDRAADRKSHSHAVRLCRVKWFKETRQGLRAQPRSGVLNPNVQIVRIGLTCGD